MYSSLSFGRKKKDCSLHKCKFGRKSAKLHRRVFSTESASNIVAKTSDNYLIQPMLEWDVLCFGEIDFFKF